MDSSKGFVVTASIGTGTSGEEVLLLFVGVDSASCPPSASVLGKDFLRLVDSSKGFVVVA